MVVPYIIFIIFSTCLSFIKVFDNFDNIKYMRSLKIIKNFFLYFSFPLILSVSLIGVNLLFSVFLLFYKHKTFAIFVIFINSVILIYGCFVVLLHIYFVRKSCKRVDEGSIN